MTILDFDAASEFVDAVQLHVRDRTLNHPRKWFFEHFHAFVANNYKSILDNNSSHYVEARKHPIIAKIAAEQPAFFDEIPEPIRAKNDFRSLYNELGPKRGGRERYFYHIQFWMLCKFPDEPETIAISKHQFGGSFESFFGFPLPLKGEEAKREYSAFRKERLRTVLHGVEEGSERQHLSQDQNTVFQQNSSDAAKGSANIKDDLKKAQWAEQVLRTPRNVSKSTIHWIAEQQYKRGVLSHEIIEEAARVLLTDRYRDIPETAEEKELDRIVASLLRSNLDRKKARQGKE